MIYAILSAVAVSLISLVGALLFIRKKEISPGYGGIMVSMAAGVMLTAAVLDLLPEAVHQFSGSEIYWALLGGICVFFILERLLHWYHHHSHCPEHVKNCEDKQHTEPTAYLILVGDSLHNFFDGVAIATAFSVNVYVGMVTTLAIVLHEIPQELADFVALMHSGMKFKRALFFNLLTAFTAVVGVFFGWYFLSLVGGALPFLLAFNAGMFIYISCSDLIPSLHEGFKKDRRWTQTITFLLGVAVMFVLITLLHPFHDVHEEEGHSHVIEIDHPASESHLEASNLFENLV